MNVKIATRIVNQLKNITGKFVVIKNDINGHSAKTISTLTLYIADTLAHKDFDSLTQIDKFVTKKYSNYKPVFKSNKR